jgi:N-acetylmuramoyl-L-alanine amidase
MRRQVQHNDTVLFRANVAVLVPVLCLMGCASPTRRNSTLEPVWQEIPTVVPVSPEFPVGGPVESNPTVAAKVPTVSSRALPGPSETWIPLQRWSRANHFGSVAQLSGKPNPSYALRSTNGAFVLRTGSQLALWDGLDVRLGFVPQLIDGQPFVHTLDLYKTIVPLLQGEPTQLFRPLPVVVIDPGHGGENAGTKSVLGTHYEKEFTLDWALRLQAVLAANNCRALLTRSNDTDLALSNRVAFAAEHKADLFVSLHFNSAAPNENESGLETYCLTPMGMPSSLTRGFSDETQLTFPNNAFDAQNLFLALRVHRALLQVNGHHDRGIRRARFPGVLRGQQRAAVLVEGGYLSNPQEARLISDPGYRERLAEAVARALLSGGNDATLAGDASTDRLSPGTAGDHRTNQIGTPQAAIEQTQARNPTHVGIAESPR